MLVCTRRMTQWDTQLHPPDTHHHPPHCRVPVCRAPPARTGKGPRCCDRLGVRILEKRAESSHTAFPIKSAQRASISVPQGTGNCCNTELSASVWVPTVLCYTNSVLMSPWCRPPAYQTDLSSALEPRWISDTFL